jgi:hypothetical protein
MLPIGRPSIARRAARDPAPSSARIRSPAKVLGRILNDDTPMSRAPLLGCPTCARHIRVDSRACPFCGRSLPAAFGAEPVAHHPRVTRRVETLVYLAGTSALALAAACGDVVTSSDGDAGDATTKLDGAQPDDRDRMQDSRGSEFNLILDGGSDTMLDAARDVAGEGSITDTGLTDAPCPDMKCHYYPDRCCYGHCCPVTVPYGGAPVPPED